MTQQERSGFIKLMKLVGDTYGRSGTVESADLWFSILRDYSLIEVTRAIHDHLADPDVGQFYPKPADLTRRLQGTTQSRGLVAFDLARQEVRRVGSHESPTFADPLIRATIDALGGWATFCAMESDQVPFEQKRFIDRYQSYTQRPPDRIPSKLAGRHETFNAVTQFASDPRALASGQPILAPPAFRELDEGVREQVRAALPKPNPTAGGMSAFGATARKALERVNTERPASTESQAETANEARRRAREAAEALAGKSAEAGR